MADLRTLLGKPTSEVDLSQYFEPYPGDASAKNPVFNYDLEGEWEVLVYFGRHCFQEVPALPPSMSARLCTIELLPKKGFPFDNIEFPAAFKKMLSS